MTTEKLDQERDLVADLALCEAETDGLDMCVGDTDVHLSYWQPLLSEDEQYPIMARFERTEDAQMFVEAREAWPIAIRRAMAAEAEVKRLKRSYRLLLAVHDEQCARSAEYYGEIKRLQAFIESESEGALDTFLEIKKMRDESRKLGGQLANILTFIEAGVIVPKNPSNINVDFVIHNAREALLSVVQSVAD